MHTDDRPYADCYVDPDLIIAGRRYVFWFYTTYSTADVHMRYNSERGYYAFGDQLSEWSIINQLFQGILTRDVQFTLFEIND